MESLFRTPSRDLTGKVALVTGSTRGIGYGIAAVFAAAGATVVISSRHADDCQRVCQEFHDRGYPCLSTVIDLSDAAGIDGTIQRITEQAGRIDILVNNAGIGGKEAPIFDITPEEWDFTHQIDLRGVYFCAKSVAKRMRDQGTGGRIVNLASAAGIIAPKYSSVYGAAKAGVVHLTKIMANEWARYGININAVAPGYISTDMTKDVMQDTKNAEAVMRKIALRRFGEVDDVSGVVLFLVTEASKYLTGMVLPVDGGMTIS